MVLNKFTTGLKKNIINVYNNIKSRITHIYVLSKNNTVARVGILPVEGMLAFLILIYVIE